MPIWLGAWPGMGGTRNRRPDSKTPPAFRPAALPLFSMRRSGVADADLLLAPALRRTHRTPDKSETEHHHRPGCRFRDRPGLCAGESQGPASQAPGIGTKLVPDVQLPGACSVAAVKCGQRLEGPEGPAGCIHRGHGCRCFVIEREISVRVGAAAIGIGEQDGAGTDLGQGYDQIGKERVPQIVECEIDVLDDEVVRNGDGAAEVHTIGQTSARPPINERGRGRGRCSERDT